MRVLAGGHAFGQTSLPTHGEVGSRRGRERVSLSYEHALGGQWSGLIKAQIVRFDADPERGESRCRRHGLVRLVYNFDPTTLALTEGLRDNTVKIDVCLRF